ncbi:MAG: hypothetical protein O3C25_04370 [Chloroflexi bacterium]|nr:hypothetical protein [Chloroflexota bacterium]
MAGQRIASLDVVLVLVLPATSVLCMAVSTERLWMVAGFLWWFALSALPLLLLMTGHMRGRRGAVLLAVGLLALAASCGTNLELLERCADGCRFAGGA